VIYHDESGRLIRNSIYFLGVAGWLIGLLLVADSEIHVTEEILQLRLKGNLSNLYDLHLLEISILSKAAFRFSRPCCLSASDFKAMRLTSEIEIEILSNNTTSFLQPRHRACNCKTSISIRRLTNETSGRSPKRQLGRSSSGSGTRLDLALSTFSTT
jgi:hypothetical protein